MRTSVLLLASMVLASCAVRKIPGTEIEDTSDTRAIVDLISKYRTAFESKNVQGVVDVADEAFRDDGGSSTPEDDSDFKTLAHVLTARFQKVDEVKLDLNLRKVEFDEQSQNARVTFTYTLSFKMPSLTTRTQTETDIKQMTLRRQGDKGWKITSGI